MSESKDTFASLYGSQVITSQKVFRIVTPLISGLLIVVGAGLAIAVVNFRSLGVRKLPEDILVGSLAILLVTAGIALSALANGLLTKVLLEMVKLDQETLSQQVLKSRQALLDAVGVLLKSIEISPASHTLSKKQGTVSLSVTFKGVSGQEFQADKSILGMTWKSDDPNVAKVDNEGIVTWSNIGTANITASFRTITSSKCVVTTTN
jgi:hypothetical protein